MNDKIRDLINEHLIQNEQNALFIDGKYFDNSILGVTENGNIVYCYESMVEELTNRYMEDDPEISYDDAYTDAVEFIDINTIRAIRFMGTRRPVIVYLGKQISEVKNNE